ncbi:hypothetical protein V7149_00270 [Bacillus sp. JJ1503]|uniref:hypothetical protein n=1 Tax=Bacillus sp. JJ1503 TaxID=3122956 RepID=UPI002FFEB382
MGGQLVVLTEDDIRKQPDKVIELLANLARRVTSLEQQLKDAQGNVERQAQELAEVKHLAVSNEKDIAALDERTQPIPCEEGPTTDESIVIDLAKIKTFKLSDLTGKTLRIYSATDTADGISVTTTVAIDGFDGKMYVLESEVSANESHD